MAHIAHNPAAVPAAVGGYSQGLEVQPGLRYLWISGQIPQQPGGATPTTFAEQCDVAWQNVRAVLRAAGMTTDDLVKVTIFLADRRDAAENRAIRQRHLGAAAPAMTVVIAEIFDADWLLEIEAVAAK